MAFPIRNVRAYSNGDGLCALERGVLVTLRELQLGAIRSRQTTYTFSLRLIAARAGERESATLAALRRLKALGHVASQDEQVWGLT